MHVKKSTGRLIAQASRQRDAPAIEAIDYRGAAIFGTVRSVPGTDWLLIVRPHAVMQMSQYQDKLRNLLREGIALDQITPPKSVPRRGRGKKDAETR